MPRVWQMLQQLIAECQECRFLSPHGAAGIVREGRANELLLVPHRDSRTRLRVLYCSTHTHGIGERLLLQAKNSPFSLTAAAFPALLSSPHTICRTFTLNLSIHVVYCCRKREKENPSPVTYRCLPVAAAPAASRCRRPHPPTSRTSPVISLSHTHTLHITSHTSLLSPCVWISRSGISPLSHIGERFHQRKHGRQSPSASVVLSQPHHQHHHRHPLSGSLIMFSVNHRDLTVITNGCGHRSYQLSHSNSAASSSSQGSSSEGSMNSLPPPSPPRTVSLIHNSSSSSGRSLIHCNNHNLSPCSRNDSQQSLYSAAGSSSQSSVNKSIYEHEYQNLNESLMLENRRLKSEIEILKHRCSKYERVEAEIVKVCQAHEELMASSEKKEQLEKSVRIKLEAEIGRLNQENRELRNRTGTSSSLAEYELQAQRATLEETAIPYPDPGWGFDAGTGQHSEARRGTDASKDGIGGWIADRSALTSTSATSASSSSPGSCESFAGDDFRFHDGSPLILSSNKKILFLD